MSYELKDGQGSLFKNDKKGVAERPDYTGRVMIGGTTYWLSAWIKDGKKGKWMSLQAKVAEAKQEPAYRGDVDADIPF